MQVWNRGLVEEKTYGINKLDLRKDIEAEFDNENFLKTKELLEKYHYYYQSTDETSILYVFTLLGLNMVYEAEKYSQKMIADSGGSSKYGYYLSGIVEYRKKNFQKSKEYFDYGRRYGLSDNMIKDFLEDDYYRVMNFK